MTRPDSPLSGVFRVVYFLALAVVSTSAVLTGVMALYDPPNDAASLSDSFDDPGLDLDGDTEPDVTIDELLGVSPETADYNRNVTLIYAAFAAALFAIPALGLGSRFNPLRAGLLAGGLLVFLVAMGYWADSSDEWLGFLMTLVCFAVLALSFPWLEDGIPIKPREPVRRIEIPPSGGSPPPPPAPPHPPPPPPPPPPPSPSPAGPSVPMWERPPSEPDPERSPPP